MADGAGGGAGASNAMGEVMASNAMGEALDNADDGGLLLGVLVKMPYFEHGNVRIVCRRWDQIITSETFREQRRKLGYGEHGVVVAGGYGDVVAGFATPTPDCWMLKGGRWRSIAPMSAPRHSFCTAVYEGEMFVIGGVDGARRSVSTVEAYNPQTNTWRSCPPMCIARQGAVTGVVGGSLVVCGGTTRLGGVVDIGLKSEAYTAETGWVALPPMPCCTWMATACVLGGKLYVAGGSGALRNLQTGVGWDLLDVQPGRAHGSRTHFRPIRRA